MTRDEATRIARTIEDKNRALTRLENIKHGIEIGYHMGIARKRGESAGRRFRKNHVNFHGPYPSDDEIMMAGETRAWKEMGRGVDRPILTEFENAFFRTAHGEPA